MLKIMVVGGPAEDYIVRCLTSIINQSVLDWDAQVVLDPVNDKTYEIAKAYERPNLKVLLNDKQEYALPNLLKASELLNPSDDDILVTVDADDWLFSYDTPSHKDSLSIVKSYYDRNPELLLTHGSWRSFPNAGANTNNAPYTRHEFDNNLRKFAWRASHLRTFKYKVWKHINVEDLKDADGKFFRSAWDLAFVFPMLEMAGLDRIQFIREPIYTYNQETPFSDTRMRLQEQMYYTDYIAAMPQYKYRENF